MSLLLALSASGAPVDYTLSCNAGAYSIAGQNVSFSHGYGLVCSSGAYSITGNAATLTYQSASGSSDWLIQARRRGRR